MVYCSKCGTKNEEVAETCVKCGAKLIVQREENWEKRLENGAEEFGKRAEVWGENVDRFYPLFGTPQKNMIKKAKKSPQD
ncbi:zinc-ribbon domain-containing protein [Candidatus Bathyarchaeota archaeon]|nr:zinc-ribbon domain-containing protein [Candidatus Bathyarchaeota archaeon]